MFRRASPLFAQVGAATDASKELFDRSVFMEMWNEGLAQQQVVVQLAFGWLDDALEVPIDALTWSRALFVLELLPIYEKQHGSVALGFKLSQGKDGKEYAAIIDKTLKYASGDEAPIKALDEEEYTINIEEGDMTNSSDGTRALPSFFYEDAAELGSDLLGMLQKALGGPVKGSQESA